MKLVSHLLPCSAIIRLLAICAALWTGLAAGMAVAQDAYRLGDGDTVSVRIVSWDPIGQDFVEFGALNDTLMVGPEGFIMMPLVGPVQARGRDLNAVAAEISERLQARMGLESQPSASLSVVGYRPVYVMGAVGDPGPFVYTPQLTVLQAVALAGGVDVRLEEGAGGGIAGIVRAQGQLGEIAIDRVRYEVRAARLRAEMNVADDFDVETRVTHPGGTAALDAVVTQERNLFSSRREAQARALQAIEDSRLLLEAEIEALRGKQGGRERQVGLLRKSVEDMGKLLERGLAQRSSYAALQRQLIDLEARELDMETELFRARQQINDLERDRIEIEARRRLEVLHELQGTEAEIDRLVVRNETTFRLLALSEAMLGSAGTTTNVRLSYRITRDGGDGPIDIEADPGTQLEPADVLEVLAETITEGQ